MFSELDIVYFSVIKMLSFELSAGQHTLTRVTEAPDWWLLVVRPNVWLPVLTTIRK